MDKLSILDAYAFYRESPQPLQAAIAAAATRARLAPREIFYREGDVCGHFALVGKGNIRVFKSSETGREVTLYHVQDGEPCLVNMLCVLLKRPSMATAQAEVATEAVLLPGADVRNWVAESEALRDFIFETMASRVVDMTTLVEAVSFQKIDIRLAALLLERFATARVVAATHDEIAAELGTVREVVSRLLKEYVRHGAIRSSRGHLELADETILRTFIER